MNLQDLSLYLESRLREGLLVSGIGWSLVLCFGAAYVCYYFGTTAKAKTIREFDKQFTTVMFGYPTAEDYYEDASPCHKLKKIGIPVLCLNSLDDAFSSDHAIPVEIAKQNPNIALIRTSYGGHYGFLEDRGQESVRTWTESSNNLFKLSLIMGAKLLLSSNLSE